MYNGKKLKIYSYSRECNNLINILKLNNQKQIIKWQILNCRNIQNLIVNYIGFTPKTKKELTQAIILWCKNKKEAIKKYGDINTWNVHNITDMSDLFSDYFYFNDNINNWNVSNVTNMRNMLSYCYNFNQPLKNWNVSNIKDMSGMFLNCLKFNQPLNNWDVSKVKNMKNMFKDCWYFNQELNNWDVSNVKNIEGMFYNCTRFSQPLNNWDVSNVKNMKNMFINCGMLNFYNYDIPDWYSNYKN